MRSKRETSRYQLPLFTSPKNPTLSDDAIPYDVTIYRVALVRESSIQVPEKRLRNSQDAASLIRKYLQGADREHFVALLLNRKNAMIGLNTVSVGTLTASLAHPREIFKAAILANAAAIVCAHNHPSGDPQPSSEDRVLTKRLVEAGKLLGIEVVDHIIVGDGTEAYFSFADNNLLDRSS